MSISAVTYDAAGRIVSWVEGEYSYKVSRDTAGRPMYLAGTSAGRKTVSVQFIYNGSGGTFSGMLGASTSILLADLVRDAASGGAVPIFGTLDGSGQIATLVGPANKPTPAGGGGGVTVINDVTTGGTTYALSAEQGKSLNTLKAPLASPTFTGTPAAPTAAADTNTTQLATTAFVAGQAGSAAPNMSGTAAVGTSLRFARQDHTHPSDTSRAPLASPTFTGTPAAPTAVAGTSTTQIATTAFAMTAAANAVAALVNSAPAQLDTLNELATALGNDANFASTMTTALAAKAPLASPTFTGTPAVPTAAADTNTTQAASTAFVLGQAGTANPLINGTAAPGSSTRLARQDHVHPTDTSRAPLALNVQAAKTTAYTLVAGDIRSIIPVNAATSTTITLNTGLGAGFSAVLVQKGAGAITVSGTATLRGTTSTTNQYDALTITPIGTDEYLCKVG